MIKAECISKYYDGKPIIRDLSFELKTNNLYLLQGANGSGKTTLIRMIVDLVKPTTGEILINGVANNKTEVFQVFGTFLGNNTLIPFLYAEEYFELVNELRGGSTDLKAFYSDLKVFFNNEILSQSKTIAKFSEGNKAKVGIAAAFIGKPQFIAFDEPFAHLDYSATVELTTLIKNRYWNKNGGGIISNHYVNMTNDYFDGIITL
jgi:ABC-2 type transport system ATP-binding protein